MERALSLQQFSLVINVQRNRGQEVDTLAEQDDFGIILHDISSFHCSGLQRSTELRPYELPMSAVPNVASPWAPQQW